MQRCWSWAGADGNTWRGSCAWHWTPPHKVASVVGILLHGCTYGQATQNTVCCCLVLFACAARSTKLLERELCMVVCCGRLLLQVKNAKSRRKPAASNTYIK